MAYNPQMEVEPPPQPNPNALEIWGNQTTMNLGNVLLLNIQSSPYFKDLFRLKTYHEVLQEIQEKVQYLGPWVPGGGKTPSTAWCLLYKLYTLRLTFKQMNGMLNNEDPYIRFMGCLYLRLTCPPKQLWEWLEGYVDDDEEVVMHPKSNPVAVGQAVKELIREQRFMDVLLPRIPVPVHREMQQRLSEHEEEVAQQVAAEQGYVHQPEEAQQDERSKNKDRKDSDRGRDRDKDSEREKDRDRRDRRKSRSRSRERRVGRDSRRRSRSRDRREREHSHRADRDWRKRSRSKSRDRSKSPQRDKQRNQSRSPRKRSRSRSGERSPSRQSTAPPKKKSAEAAAAMQKLRDMYGATTSTKIEESGKSFKKDSGSQDTILLGSFRR